MAVDFIMIANTTITLPSLLLIFLLFYQMNIIAHEIGGEEGSQIENEEALKKAAELLGCDPSNLSTSICRRTVKVRK